jgi:chitin disaccharide deacetylase
MAAKRIRLCLRGDDAGMSVGTNQAIEQAVRSGACRNVSIMAAAPAWEDAALRFKDVPGLCVGLHVALNCEWDQPRWGPVARRERVVDLVEPDGTLTHTSGDE